MALSGEKKAERGVCYVIGAAPGAFSGVSVPNIRPGDLCAAADGGHLLLKELGITPDITVGDFDSSPPPEDHSFLRLEKAKDVTDLYAAVQLGKERGFRDFLIFGALGGSWGHSVANLQILAGLEKEGLSAALISGNVRVRALTEGSLTLSRSGGAKVSILAFGGKAEGVTLKGMLYPLNEAVLDCRFPLGVSNELIGKTAKISVRRGTVLIFQEQ
jgi:thiamine pyrophosphokinase